jgi:hypothetical protein
LKNSGSREKLPGKSGNEKINYEIFSVEFFILRKSNLTKFTD